MIAAVALWVESAWQVAVTATAWVAKVLAGAVYTPDGESVPTAGLIDQITALLLEPVTCAAN